MKCSRAPRARRPPTCSPSPPDRVPLTRILQPRLVRGFFLRAVRSGSRRPIAGSRGEGRVLLPAFAGYRRHETSRFPRCGPGNERRPRCNSAGASFRVTVVPRSLERRLDERRNEARGSSGQPRFSLRANARVPLDLGARVRKINGRQRSRGTRRLISPGMVASDQARYEVRRSHGTSRLRGLTAAAGAAGVLRCMPPARRLRREAACGRR